MSTLPGGAKTIAEDFPEIWAAYSSLGAATAGAGPLTERERRLVKLALSIGAGSEGATHSHSRRAVAEGVETGAIEQVALLACGPLGFRAPWRR